MSLYDRLETAIARLAPGWAASRVAARVALDQAARAESLGAYRNASHTRIDRSAPTVRGAGADWTLERERDRRDLVDRGRQLEQNSPIAEALLSRATESVVGGGFGLQAATADPAWNEQAEALWSAWAENGADVRGLSTLGELVDFVYRGWLRDGDVAVVRLASGSVRVVESDEIASPEGYSRPDLVDGVELDASGRPVAFHVLSQPRTLLVDRRASYDRVRIPAEDVEFLARRQRAGQTRGLSAFSGVGWILDQVDGNVEAVTVANRMAACLGLVLKRKSRMAGMATTTGADGIARRKLRLEPGGFIELDTDEDIGTVQGHAIEGNFVDFIRFLSRLASIAFGLPLELTLMDFERSNYSSARAALLQAWNVWRRHQRMLKSLYRRLYAWKVLAWMEAGLLPVREDAFAHSWIAPGWQWLDPVAEIQAAQASVDAGFDSRTNIAHRLGHELEDVVRAQARELELFRQAGVPLVRSILTRDPPRDDPAPRQDDPPPDDGED